MIGTPDQRMRISLRWRMATALVVLAHELSHLHNGDSRIMGVALVPTLLADRVGASGPPEIDWFVRQPLVFVGRYVAWLLVAALTAVQRLCGQFGVGLLSRSREFAADRGAAKLTGSPAILASALETLSDARSRPAEDLRSWQQSATAPDILPVERADGWTGTHPDTDTVVRDYFRDRVTHIDVSGCEGHNFWLHGGKESRTTV